MATKKKLLQAAAGTAAASGGAGALNVEDVFSTYLYEGNGGTKVIENGINLGQSYGSGSVEFEQNSSYLKLPSEITLTGDFTIEAMVWSNSGFTSQNQILGSDTGGGSNLNTQVYIQNTTNYLSLYDNGAAHRSTSAVPQDQWVHIAITRSGSTVTFYINGTASGTSSTSATIAVWAVGALISGASVYEDYYGYISNVRIVDGSVVYTSNFTPPTSDLTAITNTQLLTCQGDSPFVDNSSNAYVLTAINTPIAKTFGPFDAADAGEGGLVWIKGRDAARSHQLLNTEVGLSGTGSRLNSNTTSVSSNDTATSMSSFNSDGFSIQYANDFNANGEDFASWTFRKAPKFFTMVQWSGNSTMGRTISHDLGTNVGFILIKAVDKNDAWYALHKDSNLLILDQATAEYNDATTADYFGDGTNIVRPTSTEFTIGSDAGINGTGYNYIAYLFAHNDGDGDFGDGTQDIIKCGSYTGTGSSNFIDLGFEPQWILVKRSSGTAAWELYDNMRGLSGGHVNMLSPSSSSAEVDTAASETFSPNPTGMTIEGGNFSTNYSGSTYIYIAIRRGPMAVPTDATDVFSVELNSGTGAYSETTGWPVDLVIQNDRTGTYGIHRPYDRVRGGKYLETSTTGGEGTAAFGFDNSTGYSSSSSISAVDWVWKRAPNYFDVVAYTGNGTAGRTVSHNLGVAPEMMWVKNRGTDGEVRKWVVYHKDTGNSGYLVLNETSSLNTTDPQSKFGNGTVAVAPTATDFTVAGDFEVNYSGSTYIAYLFASLDGVSKVGSYTGNGTSQTIDCGFSSGARFVLIKRTDISANWHVWDTERGIVSGNDPWLELNTTDAENTSYDSIDPHSSGFTVNEDAGTGVNFSSGSYIFYAISA